jgi:hypothetical protein
MPDGISIFRIDYEIRSSEDGEQKLWSACIAAYSQEEALAYLGKFLGKTFKTIQFERRSRLDAITDPVRQKIIDNYLLEQAEEKKGKPVKEEKKKEVKPRGKSITKK